MWEVCQRGESEEEINVIGHVAVYVDDLMVVVEKEVAKDIMKELGRTFKMAEPEEVTLEKEVTLCGYHTTSRRRRKACTSPRKVHRGVGEEA